MAAPVDAHEEVLTGWGKRNLFIAWPHKDDFAVELLYDAGPRGRIIIMSGFAANIRIFHKLRASDCILSVRTFDDRERVFETNRNLIDLFDLDAGRIVFLCNTADQAEVARRCGLRSDVFNANALLDEQVFRILPRRKIYDAVSNARLIKLKRTYLARRVGNLAIIAGHRLEEGEYDAPEEVPHTFLASSWLRTNQVVEILCRAKVGLALSAHEGACFASSEYLLCGLPVVTTPCSGGREVWYEGHNSLVVEPTEEAVAAWVREMIGRLERGEVNPHEIRERHIRKAEEERGRLVAVLGRLLADAGIQIDAARLFRDKFHHKLGCNFQTTFAQLSQIL